MPWDEVHTPVQAAAPTARRSTRMVTGSSMLMTYRFSPLAERDSLRAVAAKWATVKNLAKTCPEPLPTFSCVGHSQRHIDRTLSVAPPPTCRASAQPHPFISTTRANRYHLVRRTHVNDCSRSSPTTHGNAPRACAKSIKRSRCEGLSAPAVSNASNILPPFQKFQPPGSCQCWLGCAPRINLGLRLAVCR